MQYRRNVFATALLGLSVIFIGVYFFGSEEKSELYSRSTNIDAIESNIATKHRAAIDDESTPVPTKTVLNNATEIYSASEDYSQCEAEQTEVWDRLNAMNKAINAELSGIDDNRLLRDAVFLLQGEGYFKTNTALFSLNRLQLEIEEQHFQLEPFQPTQEEIDKFRSANYLMEDIYEASARHDIEKTIHATRIFNQNNRKRGYALRRGKDKILWAPDVIVGHNLSTAPLSFVDDVVAQYPVSHLLFTQAVRSGASNEVLKKLLFSFDFKNRPVYTKHNNLQTALQAAIEVESLDAMRLILSQPDLQNTEFLFNPLNTIIFKALNTEEKSFTNNQKAMMDLLVEHGFRVDIYSSSYNRDLMLAGYIASIEPPIIKQLKALSISPRYIENLHIPSDSELPLHIQDQLRRYALQSQLLSDEYTAKAEACDELKQTLHSLIPPLIKIEDIADYINVENSFTENVQLLKQQSLTLVDAYYAKMIREPADIKAAQQIAVSTSSLVDISSEVSGHIDELSPVERHHLTEIYCQKFGKHAMEDIFDAVRYMNFTLLSYEGCVAGTPDDYTEIQTEFYLHDNTYPGIIYSELEPYFFEKALDTMTNPAFQRSKDLQGYPHGRDALMLILDLKLAASQFDSKDYKTLIIELIAKTDLKDEHFKRLHRLKVDNFLFFEEVASLHPQIREAVKYPLAIYRTSI